MRLALVGLLALPLLKGCDPTEIQQLTSPEAVAQAYQDGLRPYFPKAKAVAMTERQELWGYTCIQGDGPELVEQMGNFIPSIPDVQKLKTLRDWGPVFGAKTYRYAWLGFESGAVRLDVDTWSVVHVAANPKYDDMYRNACGFAR